MGRKSKRTRIKHIQQQTNHRRHNASKNTPVSVAFINDTNANASAFKVSHDGHRESASLSLPVLRADCHHSNNAANANATDNDAVISHSTRTTRTQIGPKQNPMKESSIFASSHILQEKHEMYEAEDGEIVEQANGGTPRSTADERIDLGSIEMDSTVIVEASDDTLGYSPEITPPAWNPRKRHVQASTTSSSTAASFPNKRTIISQCSQIYYTPIDDQYLVATVVQE